MENAFLLVFTSCFYIFVKGQEVCLGSNSSTALGCAAVGRADVGTWAWLNRAGRMGTVHRDLVLRALATFALLF